MTQQQILNILENNELTTEEKTNKIKILISGGIQANHIANENLNQPFDKDEFKDGFQLRFIGKDYAKMQSSQRPETLIIPDTDHNEQSENKNSENIFLTGDNLEVLKHLQNAYTNKIDMIYIDPPYNTGSDGFVYNDKFALTDTQLKETFNYTDDEINRLKMINGKSSHSAWLTFMYPRLKLARNLLNEKGVIFISIDDNEQANLKLLCDEIFGEGNFYGEFIQAKGSTQNDSKTIQRNTEYVLCYSKRNEDLLLTYNNATRKEVFENKYYLGRDTGASSGHDKLIDRANLGYTIYYYEGTGNGQTGNNNKLIDRANLISGNDFKYFQINENKFIHAVAIADYDTTNLTENSTEEEIYTDNQELLELGYIKIRPPKRTGEKLGCWTWSLSNFKETWNNDEVLIKNNKNVIKKVFIDAKDIVRENGKSYFYNENSLPLQNLLTDFATSQGTNKYKELMPEVEFSNPKNIEMLKHFIKAKYNSQKQDLLILDFFAGSASTAQAILELNAETETNHKFILNTINVETTKPTKQFKYIDQISRERIRRAANKIKEELKQDLTKQEILKTQDLGFKHYQVQPIKEKLLDELENFDTAKEQQELFNQKDILKQFSGAEILNNNQDNGEQTVLATYLIEDGLTFKDFENIQTLNINGFISYFEPKFSKLYLINDKNITDEAIQTIFNKIGNNELNISEIVVFAYNFDFHNLLTLKNNVSSNLENVKIRERY